MKHLTAYQIILSEGVRSVTRSTLRDPDGLLNFSRTTRTDIIETAICVAVALFSVVVMLSL